MLQAEATSASQKNDRNNSPPPHVLLRRWAQVPLKMMYLALVSLDEMILATSVPCFMLFSSALCTQFGFRAHITHYRSQIQLILQALPDLPSVRTNMNLNMTVLEK